MGKSMRSIKGSFWSLVVGMMLLLTGCGSEAVFDPDLIGGSGGPLPGPDGPFSVVVEPEDGATGVAVDVIIAGTFNKEADPVTINSTTVYLTSDGSDHILGNIDYSNKVMTFKPVADLEPNTTYQFTITTGVTTPDGEALNETYNTLFTTGEGYREVSGAIISMGTSTASVDTNQSDLLGPLVGGLLGTQLQVDAVAWQGVAEIDLNTAALLGAAGEATGSTTVGDLINSELTVEELLNITSGLMSGMDEAQAQSVIDELIAELTGGGTGGTTFPLAELLQVPTGMLDMPLNDFLSLQGVSSSSVNTVSLLEGLNNILNPILMEPIMLNLEPLVDLDLKVQVLTPPQVAVLEEGETMYSSSTRLYLNLGIGDNLLGGALKELLNGLGIEGDILRLPLYLVLGSSEARLTALTSDTIDLDVKNGLTRVYIGDIDEDIFFTDTPLSAEDFDAVDVLNVDLLGIGILSLKVKVYAEGEGTTTPMSFFPVPVHQHNAAFAPAGSDVSSLLGTLSTAEDLYVSLELLDSIELDLTDILLTVTGLLDGLVSPLSPLLNNVSSLLGVYAGRTDVTVMGVIE